MDPYDLPALLAEVDIFQGVPAEVLAELSLGSSIEGVEASGYVFVENEPSRDVYLVLDGAIELTRTVGRGELQRLALMDRGQIFGELALFDALPRSATATAFVRSTVLRMPAELIGRLLGEAPGFAAPLLFNVVRKLSLRLRDADDALRAAAGRP